MKNITYLFLAAFFIACSSGSQTTKTEETSASSTETTMISPDKDCEGMRSKILSLISTRVPELETIGAPYIKRVTNGRGTLMFSMVRCPIAGAEDTLLRKYYEIGAGYGDDDSPAFWYRFFIAKDQQTILVADLMEVSPQPLELVRASEKWRQAWSARQ